MNKRLVKTLAISGAALGAAVFAGGFALLDATCGRRPKADFFDPDVLDREAPYKKDEMIATREWLYRQNTDEVTVESFDGLKLWGMFIPAENAKGTVLCMHGWHGDWKSNWGCFLRFFNDRGYNVLVTNERAHGKSEGHWITYGIKERYDVCSWVDYLARRLGKDHPIFLAGISMGSATVQMASVFDFPANVRGIYADCGFTSPYEIMKSVVEDSGFPPSTKKYKLTAGPLLALLDVFTKAFAGFGLKEYSTLEALPAAKYPVLFVHGLADDFVPSYMSEQGYAACRTEKELVLVPDAVHTRSWYVDRPRVSEALGAFLDKYTN